MKIRNKVTLWIAGACLLSSLVFSTFVYIELIEQPYELLDAELGNQANTLVAGLNLSENPAAVVSDDLLDQLGRLYWLKVFNKAGQVVYASEMAGLTDLALVDKDKPYTINTTVLERDVLPDNDGETDLDDQDQVAFRVRIVRVIVKNSPYTVQIARPMERLDRESGELLLTLLIAITTAVLVLLAIGYVVAGRILRPVHIINTTAKEISEKTLDKRLSRTANNDELDELASSLNTMFDRLQHSFRLQKEFIAHGAHELKTPLTSIKLFLDEAQVREDLPEEIQERLVCLSKTVSRMERLIKNLLDLSKLELQDSFRPSRFCLSNLVNEVFEEFSANIQVARIDLRMDVPGELPITADREMLRRVLINLIDNGITYNDKRNGKIRFKAHLEDGVINIVVDNSGPLVSGEDRARVFDQFFRVEKSRSVAHGGPGLGLTIVRQVILLHGGTIAMENHLNKWNRIRIQLPGSPETQCIIPPGSTHTIPGDESG